MSYSIYIDRKLPTMNLKALLLTAAVAVTAIATPANAGLRDRMNDPAPAVPIACDTIKQGATFVSEPSRTGSEWVVKNGQVYHTGYGFGECYTVQHKGALGQEITADRGTHISEHHMENGVLVRYVQDPSGSRRIVIK